MISPLLSDPTGHQAVAPNLPIMPFATPSKKATLRRPDGQDPEWRERRRSAIRISSGHMPISTVAAAPSRSATARMCSTIPHRRQSRSRAGSAVILIGNQVVIGFRRQGDRPEHDRRRSTASKPTSIGADAHDRRRHDRRRCDRLAHGAGRARCDRSGRIPRPARRECDHRRRSVQPRPGHGRARDGVRRDHDQVHALRKPSLATGYAQLYQGSSATGVNLGANPTIGGINNGNLAAIRGANLRARPVVGLVRALQERPAVSDADSGFGRRAAWQFPRADHGQGRDST